MGYESVDRFVNGVLILSILTWGVGFAMRFITTPSNWSNIDPVNMPIYRQVRIIGILRWLFGYMPVTGPVSMIGAVFQLAAFMTISFVAGTAWIWPNVFYNMNMYIAALFGGGIWMLTMVIALRFVMWLWNRQQGKK